MTEDELKKRLQQLLDSFSESDLEKSMLEIDINGSNVKSILGGADQISMHMKGPNDVIQSNDLYHLVQKNANHTKWEIDIDRIKKYVKQHRGASSIESPTGTGFSYRIDPQQKEITIISLKGNEYKYALAALKDLYTWLKMEQEGNWVLLGTKGEEQTPKDGTVEEWARAVNNPIGGYYGLTTGRKGQFAAYIPSVLEHLGFVELQHNAKNNRVRAL